MSTLTFTEFQDADVRRIEDFKNTKGEKVHIPGRDGADWTEMEWAGACCGEAGELANYCKKLRRGDYALDEVVKSDKEGRTLRQCIADEVADVVAYASIIASRIGVDFGDCVREKFNRVSERVESPIRLREEPPTPKTPGRLPDHES